MHITYTRICITLDLSQPIAYGIEFTQYTCLINDHTIGHIQCLTMANEAYFYQMLILLNILKSTVYQGGA